MFQAHSGAFLGCWTRIVGAGKRFGMPCERIMGLYSSGTLLGTASAINSSLPMHNIAHCKWTGYPWKNAPLQALLLTSMQGCYYTSWMPYIRLPYKLGQGLYMTLLQSPMPWDGFFLVYPGPDTTSHSVLLSNLGTKSKQQRSSEQALGLIIHSALSFPVQSHGCGTPRKDTSIYS
jgi:hypothetical protein